MLEEEIDEEPIVAQFDGSDLRNRRYYRVDVSFYRMRSLAKVDFGEGPSLLTQYRTADGYGYQNDSIDLRGRGDAATLTIGKRLTLSMQERKRP